jgi:glycosyltransferase involved in cell wall biosynthesis
MASSIKGLLAPSVDTLVKELLHAGNEIVIFTTDLEVKKTLCLTGDKITIYICRHRKSGHLRALTFFFSEIRQMAKCMHREKLDILHAHWTYEFAIAALWTKHKVCITIRDIAPYVFKLYRNYYRFIRLLMNQYVFAKRKRVNFIANSKYVHDMVLRSDNLVTEVIPNPIEKEFMITENSYRKKKQNNRLVSISNGWSKLKNIDKLIIAFQEIKKIIPDAELWLVGSEFVAGNIKVSEIKHYKPNFFEGIKLCGHIKHEKLSETLSLCSVLIHPSLHESFGNILLEAMAQQVPVIGGEKSGAVPWVLDNGRAGVLCNVTSAEDIAEKTIDLLTNNQKWEYYSSNGYQHVNTTYTADKVAEKTIAFYEQCIKGKME